MKVTIDGITYEGSEDEIERGRAETRATSPVPDEPIVLDSCPGVTA